MFSKAISNPFVLVKGQEMDTRKALTPEEQKLIEIYRSLDEAQRHKVMLACQSLKVADELRNRAFR